MKIITNTKRNGELCYVQVKDILFLARLTKLDKLMNQYISLINRGMGDDDFVRISQISYIDAIKNCDYIVDFTEYSDSNISTNYLSSLIVTLNFSFINDNDKECIEHKTDDLRDLISFKRGELEYKIPLVPDGKLEYASEDGLFLLESSVIKDCFVIKTTDGSSLQDKEYTKFYLDCLDKIYTEIYPDVDSACRSFEAFNHGNVYVIKVNNKSKQKKSGIQKVLSKLKKGS